MYAEIYLYAFFGTQPSSIFQEFRFPFSLSMVAGPPTLKAS